MGDNHGFDLIRTADRIDLFLDYDGTLAPFAPTPDEVLPDPALISLLERLRGQARIKLGIISGRRLAHIRKLVPLDGVLLAGTYGIEMITPAGEAVQRVDFEKIRPVLNTVKPQWASLIRSRAGFYLEDKAWSLALHAKDAEDQLADLVLAEARGFLPDNQFFAEEFRVLGGHKFLEIAPLAANKGRTIETLLEKQPLESALPVYIGDDDKDEEAFESILKNQGVAIKVSPVDVESKAQLRLKDPAAVRAFLFSLCE